MAGTWCKRDRTRSGTHEARAGVLRRPARQSRKHKASGRAARNLRADGRNAQRGSTQSNTGCSTTCANFWISHAQPSLSLSRESGQTMSTAGSAEGARCRIRWAKGEATCLGVGGGACAPQGTGWVGAGGR